MLRNGGRGQLTLPPPPHNALSEFCRYILEICRYMNADKYVICTDNVSEIINKILEEIAVFEC